MDWLSQIKQHEKAEGPYKALIAKGSFMDESRQNDDGSIREIPFKIYYPGDSKSGQTFPVIIWSHGYGGSQDGAGFLSRFLVSHGYILVHPTHRGTDSSIWEGKPGHPWDVLKDHQVSRQTTLNRYYDITFVVDELKRWGQLNPKIGQLMDLDQIGMSGHSFGAITTQVLSGQKTPNKDNKLINITDSRLVASIAYSPVPGVSHLSKGSEENDDVNIYETIQTPILLMTGTEDFSPINNLPHTDRLKVFEGIDKADKALLVKEGGDHMVYNGTRGQLAANPLRVRHEELIKWVSLAWWEYWLKSDEAAQRWLSDKAGLEAFMKSDASWRYERNNN